MKDFRIALIQTDLHWEDIQANLRMLDEKVKTIPGSVDLIVLPEMFSTGFSMSPIKFAEAMDGSAMSWLRETAMARACAITGSLMLFDDNGGTRQYHNRLVWMKPDGSFDFYDKRHLFSISDEPKEYRAGSGRIVTQIDGWKICPLICYDLRFPVWSRNAINEHREATYDVLIYVANWPERRILAWKTLLQARAIENQAYVVGVNRIGKEGENIYYSGASSVIDPLGNILYCKEHESETAIISLNFDELIKVRRQFPFLRDADRFTLDQ